MNITISNGGVRLSQGSQEVLWRPFNEALTDDEMATLHKQLLSGSFAGIPTSQPVVLANAMRRSAGRIKVQHRRMASDKFPPMRDSVSLKLKPQPNENIEGRSTADVRLTLPPGGKLRSFAFFLFKPATFHRVFEQVLADLVLEYFAAIDEDRRLNRRVLRKASWVRIRGYWAFWTAFCLQGPLSLVKRVIDIWKVIP